MAHLPSVQEALSTLNSIPIQSRKHHVSMQEQTGGPGAQGQS